MDEQPTEGGHMFQSTHPSRSATVVKIRDCECFSVSIHAPLAECDASQSAAETAKTGFNPRTPRGVRLYHIKTLLNK